MYGEAMNPHGVNATGRCYQDRFEVRSAWQTQRHSGIGSAHKVSGTSQGFRQRSRTVAPDNERNHVFLTEFPGTPSEYERYSEIRD